MICKRLVILVISLLLFIFYGQKSDRSEINEYSVTLLSFIFSIGEKLKPNAKLST